MTAPTLNPASPARIFRVNLRFLGALFVGWLGWLCWSNASLDNYGFYPLGIIGLMGGGIEFCRALYKTYEIIQGHCAWRRFGTLGAKPKADSLAQDKALVDQGKLQ